MESFRKSGVTNDVIDDVPGILLLVSWGNTNLYPGDKVWPRDIKQEPSIRYDADPEDIYTLMFVDPDAPSRADPQFGEVLHWLVVNIPGHEVQKGEVRAAYIGSGARQGTGLHRYVFLLFKQPKGKIDFSDFEYIPNNTANGRRSFKSRDFAAKNSLILIGGNFLEAEYDDSVPELHKQLGIGPFVSK